MGRVIYVCTTCSEHFTRRYSAKRHNITIHQNNGGEGVPLVEYLVGRNSGRYHASHPSWYRHSEKSIHKFGHAIVADSTGDTFRHRGLQEQYHYYPQYCQQSPSPSISFPSLPPSPAQDDSPSQPTTTTNNQGILSPETILKIQELKRLVYNSLYCPDPDAYIKSIIYFCNDGNNSFLDEKLKELHTIDNLMK
jgi:hypothetical protein